MARAQCSYGGAEKAEKPTAVEEGAPPSGDRGGGGGGGGGFGGGGRERTPSAAGGGGTRRERVADFLCALIGKPARQDRVLDLTYCAELSGPDLPLPRALALTTMFAGVRAYDLPLGDAVAALGECARGGGVDGSTIRPT